MRDPRRVNVLLTRSSVGFRVLEFRVFGFWGFTVGF